MKVLRFLSLYLPCCIAIPVLQASDWVEGKVGSLPCVTFDSFCAFYEFTPPPAVPEKQPFEMKGIYGTLTLRVDNREITYNGHKLWLSYPLLRKDDGKCYFSRLDVIKTLDPLLRRIEVAPRHPVKGVIIDPGHGGTDEGARGRGGLFEKTLTLDTANRLKDILSAQGIPVRLTRNSDVYHLLEERSDIANRNPDWIFVSLHYNSSAPSAHGIETYCLTPQYSSSTSDGSYQKRSDLERQPGNVNDLLNVLLCDYVHQEVIKLYPEDGDRGYKRARFVVLRETKIPAILVEGGFLSNASDRDMLASAAYRQKLAAAVACGIKNYMALMNSPMGKPPVVMQPSTQKAPPKTNVKPASTAPAEEENSHLTPPVDRPLRTVTPEMEGPNSTPPKDNPDPGVKSEPPVPMESENPDTQMTPQLQPPPLSPVNADTVKSIEKSGAVEADKEVRRPVVVPSFKEWERPLEPRSSDSTPTTKAPEVKANETNTGTVSAPAGQPR